MIQFEVASAAAEMEAFAFVVALEVKNAVRVLDQPDFDYYKGSYDVTPKVDQQSLPTKEKLMAENIRIRAIPYYDVGNATGGSTVYIGTLEELVSTVQLLEQRL